MGRRILIIRESCDPNDFLLIAKAKGTPEIVKGIPPVLQGKIDISSYPFVYEEPEVEKTHIKPLRITPSTNSTSI